jgi:hypothetical protein
MGDYCRIIPGHNLNRSRVSKQNPYIEFSACQGVRAVVLDYDDETCMTLNGDVIDALLYKDSLEYRQIYHNEEEVTVQFKLFIVGDNIQLINPKVLSESSNEPVEVISCISKFVDEPELPYEFKIDEHIGNKLPVWRSAFMSILLEMI